MRRPAAWVVLGLLAGGCATAAPEGGRTATPSTVPAAAPAAEGTPRPPSPREQLAAKHRAESERFEREGELRRARDHWKMALIINKDDGAAREGQTKLEGRIEGAVAQRIQEGRAALQRSSHVEARRRFLAALAMDPFNRTAFDALQNDVREVESISHTVRAGDTLATLAQRYYGDRSRGEVIWRPISSRRIRARGGRHAEDPRDPGVAFLRREPRREPRRPSPRPRPAPGERRGPRRSRRDGRSPSATSAGGQPLLADARKHSSGRVPTLPGLDRLLASTPSEREGQDLRKVALTSTARRSSTTSNTKSRTGRTQLARSSRVYEDSPRLLTAGKGAHRWTRTTARASSSTATRSSRKATASGRSCSSSTRTPPQRQGRISSRRTLTEGLEQRKQKNPPTWARAVLVGARKGRGGSCRRTAHAPSHPRPVWGPRFGAWGSPSGATRPPTRDALPASSNRRLGACIHLDIDRHHFDAKLGVGGAVH